MKERTRVTPEAYSRLIARPLSTGIESVPLTEAVGRRPARDIVADAPMPAFPTSAMDGFALDAQAFDRARSGAAVPVHGDIPAGHPPVPLPPGGAVRVMTGAQVPAVAEVVVPVEFTDAATTGPAPAEISLGGLPDTVPRGWNIRSVGEDTGLGDVVAIGGDPLNAAGVGTLAMLGIDEVEVARPVRVGLIVTGDELRDAGEGERPGAPRIPNSNLPMLVAAVAAAGAIALPRTSTDDPAHFTAVLDGLLPIVDLVVTTGGISAGAYEVVRAGLPESSAFVRVAQRPGGPQGFGERAGVPLLHLPGTPAGAFASFHLFASSLLTGSLLEDRWHRALYSGPRLDGHAKGVSLLPVGFAADGRVVPAVRARLRDFAAADAILRVPAAPGCIEDGAVVDILPYGGQGGAGAAVRAAGLAQPS